MSTGPIFLSVGGGKGGVGKSVVAANVAIACAQLGFRTALVDADFGAANQHTLFGIDRPGVTLQSLIDRGVSSIEEVTVPTGVSRLFLVPGIGAIPGAANLPHALKLKVIRQMRKLDAEVVVIDVGAGVSFNVLDFFEVGDVRFVVTSPQLPAMQNAYCFLKAAVYRVLRKRLDKPSRDRLQALIHNSETDRFRELRARARQADAGLDLVFEQVTGGLEARIVGNMMERPAQRKVFDALARMSHDFLDVQVPVAAMLGFRREVHDSVTRRRPFLLANPTHPDARVLRSLAESAVTVDVEAIRRRRITARPPPLPPPLSLAPRAAEDRFGVPLVHYLRSDQRVSVDHPVHVRTGSAEFGARMADVSPAGALLVGQLSVPVGARIEFTLTGFTARPRLRGVVRHVSVGGDNFGVELTPESEPVARWLLRGDVPRRTEVPSGPRMLHAAGA